MYPVYGVFSLHLYLFHGILGHVDYFSRKSEMETLYTDIVNNQFTQSGSVDSWFQSFTSWLQDNSAAPTVASRIDSGKASSLIPTAYENTTVCLLGFVPVQ